MARTTPSDRIAAANAANRRRGDEKAAARLREHGWIVTPPERLARKENAMTTFTVQIQAGDGNPQPGMSVVWQAVAPAAVINAQDAEEAARLTADNQSVIDPYADGPWQIVVWTGEDITDEPAYVLDGQTWLDGQADIADRADAERGSS